MLASYGTDLGVPTDTQQINLFVDIGTNGNANRDFLMTCACSAGPAFRSRRIQRNAALPTGAIRKCRCRPGYRNRTLYNHRRGPKNICGWA